jgi:hypothetical protein
LASLKEFGGMIQAAQLFQVLNTLALVSWILLAAAPRLALTKILIRSLAVPAVLSLCYLLVVAFKFGNLDEGGFDSLENVMLLFRSPWAVTAGWVHYLAFDLFVGVWIVGDSEERRVSRWFVGPCLFFTFMLGPIGLVLYLAVRTIAQDSGSPANLLSRLFREFGERNKLLTVSGILFLLAGVLTTVLVFVDPRLLDDSPLWLKPTKFFISMGIYFFTVAWILGDGLAAAQPKYAARFAAWTLVVGVAELTIICAQAIRGVRSHYNTASVLDDVLYKAMGVFIVLNLFLFIDLWRRWRKTASGSPVYLLAASYGNLLFVVTGFLAMYMSALPWSRVGLHDSATLVPVTGWNQAGGDLRISHFFGIHGIQLFLIFGHVFRESSVKRWQVHLGGSLYLIIIIALFYLAARGVPLLAP